VSGVSEDIKSNNGPLSKRVNRERLKNFLATQRADYIAARPKSFEAHEIKGKSGKANGFLGGVPQHWMLDWSTPFPLQIKSAKGCKVVDIDDNELIDLCLGDTGAMFGHSPEIIASALRDAADNGLTAMLPSQYSNEVGQKLVEIFGLPYWQLALSASDANRFALRVARLASGRQKILVFDGCYHGAVDETIVYLNGRGKTNAKPSLWGSAFDPASNTYCVPFNDKEELYAALIGEDVACIIMEPALTNCGIVPPQDGFLEFAIETAHKFGTFVLFDETHTLSTGYGGYCRIHKLEPDLFVAGKAVAGGVPAAIWGISEDVKNRLEDARAVLPAGHSGIGTTLGGSLLQMGTLYASLNQLVTPETYGKMLATAQLLEDGLNKIITEFGLDWSIIRIGARMEIIFSKTIPQNADEMRAIFDHELETALHLGLINLGFLVTPFHNMLLAGPNHTQENILNYAQSVRQIIGQICD
jgi:glutamate-1-semialdehyde 2,1-aminomutase